MGMASSSFGQEMQVCVLDVFNNKPHSFSLSFFFFFVYSSLCLCIGYTVSSIANIKVDP